MPDATVVARVLRGEAIHRATHLAEYAYETTQNCRPLLYTSANIRLMESAVNPSISNRFRGLTGLAGRFTALAAMVVVASALALPALASTITFETANVGLFTGPVTESGFTYSKLSGVLLVNPLLVGNPGKDAEGTISGGGVLKIVSAAGGNFNFNALDF